MPQLKANRGPLAPLWRALGYADFRSLPVGISFAGGMHPTSDVEFLADMTWIDDEGERKTGQEIFDRILSIIRSAQKLIVLDMFLFNDLLQRDGGRNRPLSRELTDALITQKEKHRDIRIYFITDPCNTVYNAIPSVYFEQLENAGIPVILSNTDRLRDSNPIYSFFWRMLIRPFGNSPGGLMPNPFSNDGSRISMRSYLHILNIKANHRKTILADQDEDWVAIVTTANPHDASSAHRNVGIRFSGPAVRDLYISEMAVLSLSGVEPPDLDIHPRPQRGENTVQVLTEGKIRDGVLDVIDRAQSGDRIDMILFYLAQRDVLNALRLAHRRGVAIRIVLDPNKDAFGWSKTGIPNRPVAYRLDKLGIPVRWADTHGEQCHSKMLIAHYAGGASALIEGSANFTRRNLDDFNLETDVRVTGPSDSPALARAADIFERLWNNEPGRRHTVDYAVYEEKSLLQHWLYWFMEKTGISTF